MSSLPGCTSYLSQLMALELLAPLAALAASEAAAAAPLPFLLQPAKPSESPAPARPAIAEEARNLRRPVSCGTTTFPSEFSFEEVITFSLIKNASTPHNRPNTPRRENARSQATRQPPYFEKIEPKHFPGSIAPQTHYSILRYVVA